MPHSLPNSPSRVRLLPSQVAERIAAGEVIERPSSIVKEAVENSLDAGATAIEVRLDQGGRALVSVLDNGSGIHPDDLTLALTRHATSKVSRFEDLDDLNTFGFRGEALPSMAAVSRLSLTSRVAEPQHESAYRVHSGSSSAEPVPPILFLGSPHGTELRAEALFEDLPARLKFLKSASSEVSSCRDWIERLSLAHPQTTFRLISDSKTVLSLAACSTQKERAAQVLGVQASDLLEVDLTGLVRVRAYWARGVSLPTSRKIIQCVNGRAVKDKLLSQAISSSTRQLLLPGQFPALVLMVDVGPHQLDVNVHPTKTEVRFLDTNLVFRSVSSALHELFELQRRPERSYSLPAPPAASGFRSSFSSPAAPDGILTPSVSAPIVGSQMGLAGFQSAPLSWGPAVPEQLPPAHPTQPHPLIGAQYHGVLFRTYLLWSAGEVLFLIDQHAAHERVRFEALKSSLLSQSHQAQQLLVPEVIETESGLVPQALETLAGALNVMGFEAETFGERQIVIRSVPLAWSQVTRPGSAGDASLGARLKNLAARAEHAIGELQASPTEQTSTDALKKLLLEDETLFERLASEACRSSVRAGDHLEAAAAQQLADDLFKCQHPWNCPHGRPTLIRIKESQLEEWFQRKAPPTASLPE